MSRPSATAIVKILQTRFDFTAKTPRRGIVKVNNFDDRVEVFGLPDDVALAEDLLADDYEVEIDPFGDDAFDYLIVKAKKPEPTPDLGAVSLHRLTLDNPPSGDLPVCDCFDRSLDDLIPAIAEHLGISLTEVRDRVDFMIQKRNPRSF